MMSQEKIAELLKELHSELEKSDHLNDQEADLLNQILSDVNQMNSEAASEIDLDELEKQAVIFSENHPVISETVSQIINTLARIGI